MDNYEVFLGQKEITGTFSMHLDSAMASEFLGVKIIPWHRRLVSLLFYYLHWGYPYPAKTEVNARRLPIKRDIKLDMGDKQFDLKDMYLTGVHVSRQMNGPSRIDVDFSSRA